MRRLLSILLIFLTNSWSVSFVWAADEGHFGIYEDSNGTFNTNNAAMTGVPFNNVVNEDVTFTQNANDIDIDLAEAGRYLFGYNIESRNDTYNNRVSFHSRVTLDGTEQISGHGEGYRRNGTNDVYYLYGYGIVNASAGDDLRVEVQRDSTNNPTTHSIEANRSSFWALKLEDQWDYLRLQGADNQATTTSPQNINFTTSIENTNTSVFSHSTGTNPEQITLLETGHYLVVYNVGVDGSTNRTTITTNLSLNNADVPQSFDYSYIRNSQGSTFGVGTNMSIISATANDILRLEWGATGAVGAYGTDTITGQTSIAIVRLPDSADYLIATETTGGQTITGTTTAALTFNNQDEADSGSFSYNTGTGVTTIQQDGTYLFTHGLRTNRTDTGTNLRLSRRGSWHVNGAEQGIGVAGMYTRGNQGTPDTFDGGWSSAGILSLSNTDTVDFRYIDSGNDGAGDTVQANSAGITAVNLDTLFPTFSLTTYQFYNDNDATNPTDAKGDPDVAENNIVDLFGFHEPPSPYEEIRLRTNMTVNNGEFVPDSRQFTVQFKAGLDEDCTTGSWTDVGAAQAWEFATSSVTDGADITGSLSTTDINGQYTKSNPTAVNTNNATINDQIEYDFHLIGTNAIETNQYSFRLTESDGTLFDSYDVCPSIRVAPGPDQLLKGGNFFSTDDGVERNYFWTAD